MKRKYILPGVLLILCGIYFLIASLPGVALPGGLFLIAVGAALLITRLFSRKRYGLTIAGFLLFWLGMGRLMLDVLHIGGQYALVAVPLGVSLAFFLTHIFEYRRLGNWPIVPALVLLGFSVVFFLMLTPSVNAIFQPYYGTILPLILIVLGIVVLVRGGRRSKKLVQPAPAEPISAPEQWAQPPVEPIAPVVPAEPVEPIAPVVEAAPAESVPEEEPATVQPEPVAAEPVAAEPVIGESIIYVEPAAEVTPAVEVIETGDVPEEAKTEPAN